MNSETYYVFILYSISCVAVETELKTYKTNYYPAQQMAINDFTRTIFSETRTTAPEAYHASLIKLANAQYIKQTDLGHVAVMYLAACTQELAQPIKTNNGKFNAFFNNIWSTLNTEKRKEISQKFCALLEDRTASCKGATPLHRGLYYFDSGPLFLCQHIFRNWLGTCAYPSDPEHFIELGIYLGEPTHSSTLRERFGSEAGSISHNPFLKTNRELAMNYCFKAIYLSDRYDCNIYCRIAHADHYDYQLNQGICELRE